jgi:hypothetical protein
MKQGAKETKEKEQKSKRVYCSVTVKRMELCSPLSLIGVGSKKKQLADLWFRASAPHHSLPCGHLILIVTLASKLTD